MDTPQLFWDLFREKWRPRLASWDEVVGDKQGKAMTSAWTEEIKSAAEDAIRDFAGELARPVIIGREKINRLDVHAQEIETGSLLVAFESELAYWGYNGRSKDWREEFQKLCKIKADLRVISSTIKPKTGAAFPAFLRQKLDELRAFFDQGETGAFCLIFHTESPELDPDQPCLAYSVEADFTLRELTSIRPLIPFAE